MRLRETPYLSVQRHRLEEARFPRSNVRTVYSPRPDAAKVAALLAREITLAERARSIVPKLRPGERAEIELELAVVRRLLKLLGYSELAEQRRA